MLNFLWLFILKSRACFFFFSISIFVMYCRREKSLWKEWITDHFKNICFHSKKHNSKKYKWLFHICAKKNPLTKQIFLNKFKDASLYVGFCKQNCSEVVQFCFNELTSNKSCSSIYIMKQGDYFYCPFW